MAGSWQAAAKMGDNLNEQGQSAGSDHAMQAAFGQSRAMRQSSRVGCKDEYHAERVAQALARRIAKENPNLLVKFDGTTDIQLDQMNVGSMPPALDNADPRMVRRRQMEMEADVRRREREAEEAKERKAREDEQIAKRKAEAAAVRKRQEDGLNERKKIDEQKGLLRRQRLGLPPTATVKECLKKEKKLAEQERLQAKRKEVLPDAPAPSRHAPPAKKTKVEAGIPAGSPTLPSRASQDAPSPGLAAQNNPDFGPVSPTQRLPTQANGKHLKAPPPPPPPPPEVPWSSQADDPHIPPRQNIPAPPPASAMMTLKGKKAAKPVAKDPGALLDVLTKKWEAPPAAKTWVPPAPIGRQDPGRHPTVFNSRPQERHRDEKVPAGTLSIEVQQILNAKMQKKGVDLQEAAARRKESGRRSKWS